MEVSGRERVGGVFHPLIRQHRRAPSLSRLSAFLTIELPQNLARDRGGRVGGDADGDGGRSGSRGANSAGRKGALGGCASGGLGPWVI